MIVLILPTGPIVEEMGQMNPLYEFIDGGLKEVIFEAIVHSSMRQLARYDSTRYPLLNPRPYIVDYVLRAYGASIEDMGRSAFDRDDVDFRKITTEEYISTVGQLEFLTSWLDDAVRQLIKQSVGLENYEVDDRFKLWIGDDVVIRMREESKRDW